MTAWRCGSDGVRQVGYGLVCTIPRIKPTLIRPNFIIWRKRRREELGILMTSEFGLKLKMPSNPVGDVQVVSET